MFTDARRFKGFAAPGSHRIAHELTDRGQHAGNRIRIELGQAGRRGAMQDEAGVALDQEYMIDAIVQAVLEHDLGKRHPAAPGLDPPADSTWTETVLEYLVHVAHQAAQGFGDRLADDRADNREQRINDAGAILVDGIAERGGHRTGQCPRHRFLRCRPHQGRQPGREFPMGLLERGNTLLREQQRLALIGEQQMLEPFEVAHPGDPQAPINSWAGRNRPSGARQARPASRTDPHVPACRHAVPRWLSPPMPRPRRPCR